jgi:Lar family restriction alleviation protein
MTDKLKPCPFCGGEGDAFTAFDPNVEETWLVHCKSCEASIATPERDNTKQEATELWNTRADMHTELVEALEEVCAIQKRNYGYATMTHMELDDHCVIIRNLLRRIK